MSDWQTMRPAAEVWGQYFKQLRQSAPAQQLYVLLDLAQSASLSALLPASDAQPLFGFERGSKEAQLCPWLVRLGAVGTALGPAQKKLLDHVLSIVQTQPSASLLTTDCDMDVLLAHLRRAIDVKLQGQEPMYLAFWDPAVLAALMGQTDVDTGSRIEAVLEPAQRQALLGPIARWVCWSRSGRLVEYAAAKDAIKPAGALPISLSKTQIDAMLAANLPDLLIYYLRLNQPMLRDKLPPLPMYWFVRQQIAFASRYGLRGPRDLVNYLCLALVAGTRFDQLPRVKPVLAQVKAGTLRFDKAMDVLSEVIDDKDMQPARLLLDDAGRPLQEAALPR